MMPGSALAHSPSPPADATEPTPTRPVRMKGRQAATTCRSRVFLVGGCFLSIFVVSLHLRARARRVRPGPRIPPVDPIPNGVGCLPVLSSLGGLDQLETAPTPKDTNRTNACAAGGLGDAVTEGALRG